MNMTDKFFRDLKSRLALISMQDYKMQ